MQAFSLRVCADCGQPFMQVRLNHKFCHVNCRNRSHRRYKNQPDDAVTAQASILSYCKQVIGKLSDLQMVQAATTILTQTPEQNTKRKENILHSLS